MPAVHRVRHQYLRPEGPLKGDPALLARVAAGEESAFDAFVANHREAVWRFVRSLTRDEAAAEDALQETFIAAWRSAGSYRSDGPALGWLLSIARNAVYHQFRGHVNEPSHLESLTELGEAAGWGSSEPLASYLVQDEVERALADLSAEEREILLLRDMEGLTSEACATLLNLSVPAIKSRLHRARLRFIATYRGGSHGH